MAKRFSEMAQAWVDDNDPFYGRNSIMGGLIYGPQAPPASASSTPPAVAPPGNLQGAKSSGYSEAYGGVPWVPDYNTILQNTITANQNNLAGLTDYLGKLNTYQLGQVGVTPDMLTKSGENISAALAGTVPRDVKDTLATGAAERGVALGIPGSQMSNYDYLKSLGLTSLARQDAAQQQLTNAMGRTSSLINPTSFLASPEQLYQAQLLANIYASSPVPAAKAAEEMSALRSGMNRGSSGGGAGYTPSVYYPSGGYSAPRVVQPTVQQPSQIMQRAGQFTLTPTQVQQVTPYNPNSGVFTPQDWGYAQPQAASDVLLPFDSQLLNQPYVNSGPIDYTGQTYYPDDYWTDATGDYPMSDFYYEGG